MKSGCPLDGHSNVYAYIDNSWGIEEKDGCSNIYVVSTDGLSTHG